jgi:hypothetical protein
MTAHPPNRVPFYARPSLSVFTSVLSVVAGLLSVFTVQWISKDIAAALSGMYGPTNQNIELIWLLRLPWVSLVIGIVLGLPSIVVEKRMLRTRVAFFSMFILSPLRQRIKWHNYRESLISASPFIIGPLIGICLALVLRVSPIPAFFGTGMWTFLTYPESKAIFEAAKAQEIT